MGKASNRRKKRRREYLGRLARENPTKFKSEWRKREDSWTEEVGRRAVRLTDEDGNRTPEAFALLDHVINELIACGEEAVDLEFENTKETITDSCCRSVAAAADSRMYRLSNSRSNQRHMEAGTHKPPR